MKGNILMANDMGKQGGSERASSFAPIESGTPKTGFSTPTPTKQNCFEPRRGFGGTNKGAH